MRPLPWPVDLGLALLAASPSQLRSRSEPRVPACARDGQYGAGPKPRSNRHGLQYGRQLPLQSPGQATAGRRRAISPSADRSENDSGWRNATTVSSFMAYPFLRKIGVFINARIRRLHSPSPRFSYSSMGAASRRPLKINNMGNSARSRSSITNKRPTIVTSRNNRLEMANTMASIDRLCHAGVRGRVRFGFPRAVPGIGLSIIA